MRDSTDSFFQILAGSKQSENYLSRAFQACFNSSPAFAECVLNVVWKSCALKGNPGNSSGWRCEYQPSPPKGGKIRPDLCLRHSPAKNKAKSKQAIYIESKVGARLYLKQLKNYKSAGADVLVAITKNWPEVSSVDLKKSGICTLRWQDMTHGLGKASFRTEIDRFICNEFIQYLEGAGMSYREGVTEKQLKTALDLVAYIGSESDPRKGFVVKDSFRTADSIAGLLIDARRLLQEQSSLFNECYNWGPGYFKLSDEAGGCSHAIGMQMHKKDSYTKKHLSCSFCISTKNPKRISWLIYLWGSQVEYREYRCSATKLYVNGKLDAGKVAQVILKVCDDWKVKL